MCHIIAALENDTSCFVANNTVIFEDKSMDSSGFPEVNVGSYGVSVHGSKIYGDIPANASGLDLEKDFSLFWSIHRRINLLEAVVGCDLQ